MKLADDEYWSENRIVTPALIRRMRDVEFVSDLLIGVLHGPQAGNARTIDLYYERFETFDDEFPGQRKVTRRFKETLRIIASIFPGLKETRWRNRTDFYSLFVALAQGQEAKRFLPSRAKAVRRKFEKFEADVYKRLADERARVSDAVVEYVRNVEKGVSDKPRRSKRHEILMQLLDEGFSKK